MVLERPSIAATDRSISPVMTMRVSGSAMIAISPMLSPMKKTFVCVMKCGDSDAPKNKVQTKMKTSAVSQRNSDRHDGSPVSTCWARGGAVARSDDTMLTSGRLHPLGDAQTKPSVESDRGQQQPTSYRLIPK